MNQNPDSDDVTMQPVLSNIEKKADAEENIEQLGADYQDMAV